MNETVKDKQAIDNCDRRMLTATEFVEREIEQHALTKMHTEGHARKRLARQEEQQEVEVTWVPVYVERAICDLIPDTGYAREIARAGWAWDDENPGFENDLNKWKNEAIRQRRDLIALQEKIKMESEPAPAPEPINECPGCGPGPERTVLGAYGESLIPCPLCSQAEPLAPQPERAQPDPKDARTAELECKIRVILRVADELEQIGLVLTAKEIREALQEQR